MGKAPKLRDACLKGDVKTARARIKAGAALDATDEDGLSVFHCAATGGSVVILKLMLDHGADAQALTNDGRTALHCAARRGHADAVQFLVERGLDVDAADEDGDLVFHHAALGADVRTMQILIEHGATAHAIMEDGRTALHCTARYGSVEAVQFLMDQGFTVDAVDNDGFSVFHYAAFGGDVDVMQFLIERGANAHALAKDGRTALHCAANQGTLDAVKFLLERGLAIDAVDEDGNSVYHYASRGDDRAILDFVYADPRALTDLERFALHYAARDTDVETVNNYLEEGLYSIDDVDKDGDSVFHYAAMGGDVGIMQLLIEHGANPHVVMKDGRTALHIVAQEGPAEAVEFLLEQGLDINAIDLENGFSVLHYAALGGDVDILQLLVKIGVDTQALTDDGRSALHLAARSASLEAFQFLMEQGLAIDATDEDGDTMFHHAAFGGAVTILKLLIEKGANPQAIMKDGLTALHWAAQHATVETVKFLVDQGLAVDAVDPEGLSVLHYAASGGDVGILSWLVENGADIHALTKDGRTVLHAAAEEGNNDAVNFLLEHGLAIDAREEAGGSVLHKAALTGDITTMRILIDGGADIHAPGQHGWTLLHYAAESGNVDAVKFVLGLGLVIDVESERGESALHIAAKCGDIKAIRLLIGYGADIHAMTKKQQTVLHFGANSRNAEAVEFLLGLGLSVAATDEDGVTAIHNAAVKGDVGALQVLLDHGADVHALQKNGQTALHKCAEYGSLEAARLLIQQGIAVNATDENGATALHVAALNGHVDVMHVLIEHDADPHVQTNTHQSALHMAVQGADTDAVKYALELGVDMNARAKVDDVLHTPLSLVFLSDDSKTAYDMALALCSSGASFDENDRRAVLDPLGRIESASGDSKNAPPEPALWRAGLRACVDLWILEHSVDVASLTTVPIEVVNRGEASVKTYLADVAQSADDDRLHRCKICVVGPSEWGKTSLVHSLKSNETFLTEKKDRTVGIDLTTWVSKSIVDDAAVRLEVTFWDFAGQDVYQAAHTLFFSARTLFVLVVDLEAYWNELQDAEGKSDRISEAQMNRFVGAKIFRWVRSIFAHQPDAQFVVAGTKVNRLQDARVVAEIWDDLRDRLDHWKAAFAKGLDRELLPAHASAKDIKALQAKLANLASSNWLVANIMDADSIGDTRGAVQKTITTSELGFPMWKTYTQVLQSVVRRREAARSAATARDRIENSIIRFSNLRRQLLREVDTLDREACEQILRTLNDLGDVLWYEHDGAGVFKDCIILDPMLVIEVVREVVRHDFSSHNDGKSPRDGRIPHTLLSTFPLWADMDVELMHAFKALLQHFQLAYPADADVMLPESDIIVPAYWNADPPSPARGAASKSSKSIASQKSVCDAFAVHRWCWEYEVPSELSETIFVQFAVQSHSAYLARTIRGFCVEAACAEFATSISLVQNDSSRDVLRIEVSGESADLSWHNMRFYLMKMEKVLEGYGGDVIWRSIVHRPTGSTAENRHAIGPLVKAIEDAIVMGKGEQAVRATMPWMPPDLDWFLRKAWNDITSFQQLQMNQLIEEKLEVLRKLAIAGDAPRQFPALWSLEYIPEAHKAMLRMSSDLSGRCYHVPIEIDTGSPLLARHASVFKAGISLFATVVGDAVTLPLVQNVIDAAKAALDDKADAAERVHNLIDKLDLSSTSASQTFDTRTNSRLSPGASMMLLRDLLKAYDDSLDALEISEITNLECAVTASGEYVWAHAHEISAMGGKITRCSAPPSTWNDLEFPEDSSIPAKASPTASSTVVSSPSSVSSKSASVAFKFSLCVDAVDGLADWDWYKTYCKWQLYYGRKALKPLAIDVTPTNGDSSHPPSWRTMRTSIEAVASVEMLRECRLTVQVKRRSRIGWTKLIGEGEVWLRDFMNADPTKRFACAPIVVPLDTTTDRAVVIHLAAEN